MRNIFTICFMASAAAFILLGNFLAYHPDPISGKMARPADIYALIMGGILILIASIFFHEVSSREAR